MIAGRRGNAGIVVPLHLEAKTIAVAIRKAQVDLNRTGTGVDAMTGMTVTATVLEDKNGIEDTVTAILIDVGGCIVSGQGRMSTHTTATGHDLRLPSDGNDQGVTLTHLHRVDDRVLLYRHRMIPSAEIEIWPCKTVHQSRSRKPTTNLLVC